MLLQGLKSKRSYGIDWNARSNSISECRRARHSPPLFGWSSVATQINFNDESMGNCPCYLLIDFDINIHMKKIHAGDILVTLPFAYIISQSLLTMNLFWFFGALWIFDTYAHLRRKRNV
jgi:hypothetical protein